MLITLIAAIMVMAAYFLLLYAEVGFIQEKRFASSAHEDIRSLIPEHKEERFKGAHAIGWILVCIALLLFIGALIISVWDGANRGYGFWKFFARFISVLYIMELYDIFFFDWFLLCRSGFFPRYYPEVKGITGPHMFGYNMKSHIRHLIIYIPASALLSWLCTLI